MKEYIKFKNPLSIKEKKEKIGRTKSLLKNRSTAPSPKGEGEGGRGKRSNKFKNPLFIKAQKQKLEEQKVY